MSLLLYVEDHPPARLLMQAIIADLTTHTLITAGTCAEAKKAATEKMPAVYIVDLDLPDGDGITLVGELVKIHPAPALITSAYADVAASDMQATGIFAYLRKPLDPEHVARIIDRAASGLV